MAAGCSFVSESSDVTSSAETVTKTPLGRSVAEDDPLVPLGPVSARVVIPSTEATAARCGTGVAIFRATEVGRLLIDEARLSVPAPTTAEEQAAFKADCTQGRDFEVAPASGDVTADDLLFVLELLPQADSSHLEISTARGTVFGDADLSSFIAEVRDDSFNPDAPYVEVVREEEIAQRLLSSRGNFVGHRFTTTIKERWTHADNTCEFVETVETALRLRSPSHFGIELALPGLTKRTEKHDPACVAPTT